MTRVLVDTNVFLYARGRAHDYREPCRAVLRAAAAGSIRLEASVEVVQEFAHVLIRRGVDRSSAVAQAQEVNAQCLLHAFDEDVLTRALTLVADYSTLGMRDAVHAATALGADIAQVVSADRIFDGVEGITRVDPLDPGAPWNLTGRSVDV
ncbi:MAG TPA: type II toxin-antitoxin system VapC family toxin [Euzebyales bacterium]